MAPVTKELGEANGISRFEKRGFDQAKRSGGSCGERLDKIGRGACTRGDASIIAEKRIFSLLLPNGREEKPFILTRFLASPRRLIFFFLEGEEKQLSREEGRSREREREEYSPILGFGVRIVFQLDATRPDSAHFSPRVHLPSRVSRGSQPPRSNESLFSRSNRGCTPLIQNPDTDVACGLYNASSGKYVSVHFTGSRGH